MYLFFFFFAIAASSLLIVSKRCGTNVPLKLSIANRSEKCNLYMCTVSASYGIEPKKRHTPLLGVRRRDLGHIKGEIRTSCR